MDILLSTSGSDRGTAYAISNKIVRTQDRLYVGWLDAPPGPGEKARLMLGVCDPNSGVCLNTVVLGDAEDNHCGPALVVDATGRFHMIIGAHGQHHKVGKGAFFYRWSDTPEEAESWSEPERLGPADTYPALVVDSKNNLHLVHRECGLTYDAHWQLWYRCKPHGQAWVKPRPLVESPTHGYCHFGHHLRVGPDDSLHVLFRFHHGPTGKGANCNTYAVAHLDSVDGGKSWRSDSVPLKTYPSQMDDIRLAESHPVGNVGSSSLLVDAHGHPVFMTTNPDRDIPRLHRRTDDGWIAVDLRDDKDVGRAFAQLKTGVLSWDAQGNIHLVSTASPDGETTRWDDPRLELYHHVYDIDGLRKSCKQVTSGDPSAAFWHPNLENWDWHRRDIVCQDGHWLLYTHGLNQGGIGGDNRNALKTKIYLTKI